MDNEVYQSSKLEVLLGPLLNQLRRVLTRYNLIDWVRIPRLLFHFGPWRRVIRYVIRRFRPVENSVDENNLTLLHSLDASVVALEVRQNSVAIGGRLPADFVNRIRSITDRLPPGQYKLIHLIDEDVRHLSNDPVIKDVLRAYFQCEPVLLECTLAVRDPRGYNVPSLQDTFHFDYAGWDSLNVFAYFTDVNDESPYHTVIKGSHRNRSIREVLCGTLTDDEAIKKYGSSIYGIKGPAGTLFFENTEAFHRRHFSDKRRVLLNMLYASHRSSLSYGRASRQHIDKRAQIYERYKALG